MKRKSVIVLSILLLGSLMGCSETPESSSGLSLLSSGDNGSSTLSSVASSLDSAAQADVSLTTVILFTDETIDCGIKLTAIPGDSGATVYFAVLKADEEPLSAEEIVAASVNEKILACGNREGGYIAASVEVGITAELQVLLAVENQGVLSEVTLREVTSSGVRFFGGENPGELGYYPIYNLADLEEFARGYLAGEYSCFSNIRLMNDIDMSEEYGEGKKNWIPLEQFPNNATTGQDVSGTEYQGIFDGQGHTINGFYCHSDAEFVGFFKKVDTKSNTGKVPAETPGGTVKNITFTNVDVESTYNPDCGRTNGTTVYSARGTGVIAGFFRGHECSNVRILGGTVRSVGMASNLSAAVGGALGWIESNGWTEGRGDVSVCIDAIVTDVEVVTDGLYAGGIAGRMDPGSSEGAYQMRISDVAALGNVTAGGYAGGIIGYLSGQLEQAVNYGSVSVTSSGAIACGVVGRFAALSKKSDLYESLIRNVYAMGPSVSGAKVYGTLYGSASDLTPSGTLSLTVENLYVSSEMEGSLLSPLYAEQETQISFEDFLDQTLEGWELQTVEDAQYMLPIIEVAI